MGRLTRVPKSDASARDSVSKPGAGLLPTARGAWVLRAGAVFAATLSPSCGDDRSLENIDSARYAVALRVFGADTTEGTTLIGFAEDLASGEVDPTRAFEIPGAGGLWGEDGSGEFYVTSREDLTLTKYRVDDDGLAELDRVGLGGELSTLFGETMILDGSGRGYLLQLSTGQALEINLSTMEIVGPLDVTPLLDPEQQPTFISTNKIFRGREYVGVTYGTSLVEETVSNVSQIVFFNPSTKSFDLRPAPCGGLVYAMEASNGDLYFASDPWVAGIHAIDSTRAPPPCLARLAANSREPDPSPIILNELTGAPTGGLIPSGGSSIYVRVLDPRPTTNATGMELFALASWATWEIDLSPLGAPRRIERNPVAGGISYFVVDGEAYENESAADFSSTTLIRTTGPGAPAEGLRTPGVPFSVVRLRP